MSLAAGAQSLRRFMLHAPCSRALTFVTERCAAFGVLQQIPKSFLGSAADALNSHSLVITPYDH
jgi:hypothetical protein